MKIIQLATETISPQVDIIIINQNERVIINTFIILAPTMQYFSKLPADMSVRDGIIGPFEIVVVDYYNQPVSSSVILRSGVKIHSIGNEVIAPQLTGIILNKQ